MTLYDRDLFSRGRKPHVNKMFSCTGVENHLFNCSSRARNLNTEVLSGPTLDVICQGYPPRPMECEYGDVRLANGSSKTEGRLEICAYGYWAVPCTGHLSVKQAAMVCKYLGLPVDGVYQAYNSIISLLY